MTRANRGPILQAAAGRAQEVIDMGAGIRSAAVLFAVLSLLLVACGSANTSRAPSPTSRSSAPASTPPPAASPASSPADLAQVQAAAYQIFPARPGLDCGSSAPVFDRCPFTPRLRERMQAIVHSFNGPGFDPVCRCQNTYQSVSVSAEVLSGTPVAHVVLTFGTSQQKLDWVFVESSGTWLADDSFLTGQGPDTSIYNLSTS